MMVTHEPDIAAYARRIIRFLDGRIESDVPSEAGGVMLYEAHQAGAARDPPQRAALVPDHARHRHRRRRGDRHGDDRQRRDRPRSTADLPSSAAISWSCAPGQFGPAAASFDAKRRSMTGTSRR